MEQRGEVEDREFFSEDIVLDLDLKILSEKDLEDIISVFEESIRTSIDRSILRPLINAYAIETSIQAGEKLVLRAYIEIYHRKDISREIVLKLIDEALERGYRDAESIIRRFSKRNRERT
ncbi:MAG: DUF3194 domain-containing protein [Sulfolobales archaeon]